MPGGRQRGGDRRLVRGGPLAEPALVRVPAAGHQVGHGDALGRDRLLGQDAEPRGDLPGGQPVDVLAVEQHRARRGAEQAGQAPQQRRLAAGVGAHDDRDPPGRDRERQVVDDDPVVVGERQVAGGDGAGAEARAAGGGVVRWRRRSGRSCAVIRRSRCGWPGPAARAGTARRATAVTMPTGSSVGASTRRATRSEATSSRAPTAAAGQQGGAAAADQPAGDLAATTRATKPIGPGGGTATAASADADEQQARARDRSTRVPRPAAASSPRSSMRRCRASSEGDRRQQRPARQPSGRHVVPAPPVEAAGQPHHRPLGVVDLGPGQQVRGDRRQHRRDADADQHQPVAGDARACRPAGRWRGR